MRNMTAEGFAPQKQGSGDGDGSGYGLGNGYEDGSGNGYSDDIIDGSGSGYECGNGYGGGNCYGGGSGYECGNGYGGGSDYCDGNGRGYGSGIHNRGIAMYCGQKVYTIDGIGTLIDHVHGNIAKCRILQSDLTTRPCYVVRQGDTYAHGYTLRKAFAALQDKLYEDMPIEERIDAFLEAHANLTATYPAKDFYEWHHKLTGSCAPGRDAFVTNHGIDVENNRLTVAEFISLTEHNYGGEVIRQLKERVAVRYGGRYGTGKERNE